MVTVYIKKKLKIKRKKIFKNKLCYIKKLIKNQL